MRTIIDVAHELDWLRHRLAGRDARIRRLEAELTAARQQIAHLNLALAIVTPEPDTGPGPTARSTPVTPSPPDARTIALRDTISLLADMLNGNIPPDPAGR